MDVPDRFDEPLTMRWCDRVADALEQEDAPSFDEFVALHPELLRSDLLGSPRWKRSE